MKGGEVLRTVDMEVKGDGWGRVGGGLEICGLDDGGVLWGMMGVGVGVMLMGVEDVVVL